MAFDHNVGTEERYFGAINQYMIQNAAKGKTAAWAEQVADAQAIIDYLKNEHEGFLGNMRVAIINYGSLTEGQANAVRKIIADRNAKSAAWAEKLATEAALSNWVETVGDRVALEMAVQHVVTLDGIYGTTYINICKDINKNVIIYKGSNGWRKGDKVSCIARVKEHATREGVKQTIIQRPTQIKITTA